MVTHDDFWSAREVLSHVRDFARARRVSPLSTLGVVLVHAVCEIPAHVVIPPLVGGHAALNLPVALVGPPGAGKGGSESAGQDAIKFVGFPSSDIPVLPLGSAEGIARTFVDNAEETITRAIFSAPEVQTLEGLFRRQGSTLEAEIRKLAMGEQLGYANAQKHTRLIVPRLTYRAGLIVGVQPLKSGVLLAGADGGTPQRFGWFPVLDHEMPDQRPDPVDPLEIDVPQWPSPDPSIGARYVELTVPDIARNAIDAHQVAQHQGDPDIDPLDGHALLTRLKVAAALMLLDARKEINEDDWRLAGSVMTVSTRTREWCQQALRERARTTSRARALESADHDDIVAGRKLDRCRQAVIARMDRLPDGECLNRGDLRKKVRADLREHFDTAVADLMDSGQICEVPRKQGGVAYTRVPRTPVPDQDKQDDRVYTRTPVEPDMRRSETGVRIPTGVQPPIREAS